jgi:protein-S-isoprenylcysteine O-methyltransferase Ste14
MILFIGLSLSANSLYLWITHSLTVLVFAVTPWAEEAWLEEQYGEEYLEYKRGTSRFL